MGASPSVNNHRPDVTSPKGHRRDGPEGGYRRPSWRFDPEGVIADLLGHTSRLVGIDGGIVFILNQDSRFVPQWSLEVNQRAVASLPPLSLADPSNPDPMHGRSCRPRVAIQTGRARP